MTRKKTVTLLVQKSGHSFTSSPSWRNGTYSVFQILWKY